MGHGLAGMVGLWVEIPQGEGELRLPYVSVAVRITPDVHPEVVWADRIDPSRAVLTNVPSPENGRRWHDIVLHDGAANSEHKLNDRVVPVFDELEFWEPSGIPTST